MISVRLDAEAASALDVLVSGGATRSAAIREALVEAARGRRSAALREEAAAAATDSADRAEAAAVAELMESLRAAR